MDCKQITLEMVAKVSEVDSSEIVPEMDLVVDLGIDSVKAMELLIELEDRLGIELSEKSETGLHTVAELISSVQELIDELPPESAPQ